jgi:hypothetical protein
VMLSNRGQQSTADAYDLAVFSNYLRRGRADAAQGASGSAYIYFVAAGVAVGLAIAGTILWAP